MNQLKLSSMCKSTSQAVLRRMQLTFHDGASRLVQSMSAWSTKTRRAPSRHCRDPKLYGHTTTAMHVIEYTPPPSWLYDTAQQIHGYDALPAQLFITYLTLCQLPCTGNCHTLGRNRSSSSKRRGAVPGSAGYQKLPLSLHAARALSYAYTRRLFVCRCRVKRLHTKLVIGMPVPVLVCGVCFFCSFCTRYCLPHFLQGGATLFFFLDTWYLVYIYIYIRSVSYLFFSFHFEWLTLYVIYSAYCITMYLVSCTAAVSVVAF